MASQLVSHTGNLTGAPELRFGKSGAPAARFTVACSDRYRDGEGNWKDGETYFARCVAFGALAENLAASVNRGDRVTVTGQYVTNSWEHTDETTKEVSTRYSTELRADDVGASMRWAEVRVNRTRRTTAPDTVPDAWAASSEVSAASGTVEPRF